MKIYRKFEVYSVERFFQGDESKCTVRLVGQSEPSIICKGRLAVSPAILNIGWGTKIEFFFESCREEKRLRNYGSHPGPYIFEKLKIKKEGDKKVIFYTEPDLFHFEVELSQEEHKIFEKIPANYFFGGGIDLKWGD